MSTEIRKAIHALGRNFDNELLQGTIGLFADKAPRPTPDLCTVERDIAYGYDERHRLDVFKPANGGSDLPVVVFVHGGGFVGGDKGAEGAPFYNNVGAWAVANGCVGVTMTYRLAPTHQWPTGAQDIASALIWIFANIANYGGDPRRVFLMGQSAGACHVASYVAMPRLHPDGPPIRGALMLSGVYDLVTLPVHTDLEKAYYGTDARRFLEMSTLEGLVNSRIPCLYTVSELDLPNFLQQAMVLVERYMAVRGHWPRLLFLPNQNHISPVMQLGCPSDTLGAELLAFIHMQ
ncbi:MAG: alpha/beta hydrolase [Spongiibacteraceae bacterium]|jgi:triacylglycerol lipase|nr:alpha/beta hydrolase [Spongiibacteraceae bacterium]